MTQQPWLFIIEGIPPIILGVVTLFYLTDQPAQACWLSEAERNWISRELEAEKAGKKKLRSYTVGEALRDRRVLTLIVPYFFAHIGAQASIFWIPTFIKRLSGLPPPKVALLVALPGLLGIAGMLLNGWHSDRTGERRWHASIPLVCAGIAYLLIASGSSFSILWRCSFWVEEFSFLTIPFFGLSRRWFSAKPQPPLVLE